MFYHIMITLDNNDVVLCPSDQLIIDEYLQPVSVLNIKAFNAMFTNVDYTDTVVDFLISKYSDKNSDTESIVLESIKLLFER